MITWVEQVQSHCGNLRVEEDKWELGTVGSRATESPWKMEGMGAGLNPSRGHRRGRALQEVRCKGVGGAAWPRGRSVRA